MLQIKISYSKWTIKTWWEDLKPVHPSLTFSRSDKSVLYTDEACVPKLYVDPNDKTFEHANLEQKKLSELLDSIPGAPRVAPELKDYVLVTKTTKYNYNPEREREIRNAVDEHLGMTVPEETADGTIKLVYHDPKYVDVTYCDVIVAAPLPDLTLFDFFCTISFGCMYIDCFIKVVYLTYAFVSIIWVIIEPWVAPYIAALKRVCKPYDQAFRTILLPWLSKLFEGWLSPSSLLRILYIWNITVAVILILWIWWKWFL